MPKVEIRNLYELVPKKVNPISDYPLKDDLQIDLPFRMIINGASGSMKSNWALNLLQLIGVFLKVYVIAKQIDEPLYQMLKERMEPVEKKLKRKILFMSDKLEDLPNVDEFDGKSNTLIIIDDFIQVKGAPLERINEYFLRGRKKNVSLIFISQRYYQISKLIRDNASHVILKSIKSMVDLDNIGREFSLGKTKEELRSMYNFVRKRDKKAAFLIDLETTDDDLKYRMDFTPLIEIMNEVTVGKALDLKDRRK